MSEHKVKVILPSSGEEIELIRLGIFDLWDIEPEDIGPYTYEIVISGPGGGNELRYNVAYYLEDLDEPPSLPTVRLEEIKPGSEEYYQLKDYLLFQESLLHQARRLASFDEFINKAIERIIHRCFCFKEDQDLSLIRSVDDWLAVVKAVLPIPLGRQHVFYVLRRELRAGFDDLDLEEALKSLAPGKSSYHYLHHLELTVLNALGWTEEEWEALGLMGRARRLSAPMLSNLLSALEAEDAIQRNKAPAHTKMDSSGSPAVPGHPGGAEEQDAEGGRRSRDG